MKGEMSPAKAVHNTIVDEYKSYEDAVGKDKQIYFTVFLPTREIRMVVFQVGVRSDAGLINFHGEDADGELIDLWLPHYQVAYLVTSEESSSPRRMGFGQ